MAKVLPPISDVKQNASVNHASKLLKRCYVAERELMRYLGGWFVKTSPYEIKSRMPEHLWQDSRHADALRTRILELRYPRRDVDKKYDSDVLAFIAEAAKAQDLVEMLAGLYGVVKPALLNAYRVYLERADELDDAPSVYALRHIVLDEEAHIAWGQTQLDALRGDDVTRTRVQDWANYLRAYLASIGGILGLAEKSPRPTDSAFAGRPAFTCPRSTVRDERFKRSIFHLPHENHFDVEGQAAWNRIQEWDQRLAMQVWAAISHFNEIWAAEVPASVIFDLPDQPWAFYLDLARWAYDEMRHSRMGERMMRGWGWNLADEVPFGCAQYNAMGPLDPPHRLALLYYFEDGLMREGIKPREMKILASAKDTASWQDMDYDWADEAQHVHYGYVWVRHLLGIKDDSRFDLGQITNEARAHMLEYVESVKNQPAAHLAPFFDHLYEKLQSAPLVELKTDPNERFDWQPIRAQQE